MPRVERAERVAFSRLSVTVVGRWPAASSGKAPQRSGDLPGELCYDSPVEGT
jgi:hypothetical protein